MNVEFFKRVNKRNEHRPIDFVKLLEWAQEDSKLEKNTSKYRKFLKENPEATRKEISLRKLNAFPAVIFSGTFTGTGKSEDINEMSGLIVLDFDHINDDLNALWDDLSEDPLVHVMFISPSNDGLKIIVRHDLEKPENWEDLYKEIEEYFIQKHFIAADQSGKDISRMCYIPFMGKFFMNDESVIYRYDGKFERQREALKVAEETFGSSEFKKTEITDELYKECFYMSKFLSENNINLTDSYDEWYRFGFSLCDFGEKGREIFHNISSTSEKYDASEVDEKYDKLLEDYNGDKAGIEKFLSKAKEEISNMVNEKINNEILLPPIELYRDLPSALRIPLMKYSGVQKFMALVAGIANISGILPNVRFQHYGTYEYEANLFAWIIAKQSTGKNVINEMQKLTEIIENKIQKENKRAFAKFMEKKTEAEKEGNEFTEPYPEYKSLYLGADITKAGFVKKLQKNDGRALLTTTEAATLIGSNKSRYGSFIDLILATWGHERYQKDLNEKQFIIPESYLSLILSSTPETAYGFFASDNVENGLLSRFLTFEINSENELKFIKEKTEIPYFKEVIETNKNNIYQIWNLLNNLKEPIFVDITTEMDNHLFEQYSSYEKEAKYIYKFPPEVVKRMWVMHKRLILIFSTLFHYEKYSSFDIEMLNEIMPNGWETNDKIPCDQRALNLSDAIMLIYREAFVRLMHNIERQKYQNMNVTTRNDTIENMKLSGFSNEYLAYLFDLPLNKISTISTNGKIRFTLEQKKAIKSLVESGADGKMLAKLLKVTERMINKWCKEV